MDFEQEERKLAGEEERALRAFRTGIISPAQLGQQLEKLKARRSALQVQRAEALQEQTAPPEQIERAITDYCAETATNLATFTEDRWREFLRVIVRAIVFHRNRVKIQGQIPVSGSKIGMGAKLRLDVPVALGSPSLPRRSPAMAGRAHLSFRHCGGMTEGRPRPA